jgi:hypothetical protein
MPVAASYDRQGSIASGTFSKEVALCAKKLTDLCDAIHIRLHLSCYHCSLRGQN